MTVRDLGVAGSCDKGIPAARFRTTISIGLSRTVSRGSTFVTVGGGSGMGVRSLTACCVMSASGVLGILGGSGEAEGFGVGSCDSSSSGNSTATDTRDFLLVFVLLRFAGERAFVGDVGSWTVPSGLNS